MSLCCRVTRRHAPRGLGCGPPLDYDQDQDQVSCVLFLFGQSRAEGQSRTTLLPQQLCVANKTLRRGVGSGSSSSSSSCGGLGRTGGTSALNFPEAGSRQHRQHRRFMHARIINALIYLKTCSGIQMKAPKF